MISLSGIKVVELATGIAASYTAMAFADLGADVIKVETPKITDRDLGPSKGGAASFIAWNRNKKSIAIDLESEGGKNIMLDLLTQSDIFVEDREVSKIVLSLKEGWRLGLLSNTDPLHFNYILSRFPIMTSFDKWILSYEVGFKKPAIEIFQKGYPVGINQSRKDRRLCWLRWVPGVAQGFIPDDARTGNSGNQEGWTARSGWCRLPYCSQMGILPQRSPARRNMLSATRMRATQGAYMDRAILESNPPSGDRRDGHCRKDRSAGHPPAGLHPGRNGRGHCLQPGGAERIPQIRTQREPHRPSTGRTIGPGVEGD
jgi:hypothetical protein